MKLRSVLLWTLATLAATVLLLAAAALAAPAKDPAATAARGRVSFRMYCSSCHGQTGKGDGPVAEMLRTPPADLTQLAAANGGSYPSERVREAIDGRADVLAHGERDMPVWGTAFRQPDGPEDQEAEVAAKLEELVAFVASLQAPAKP
jgi:mono/diheme cytochrome c family protein